MSLFFFHFFDGDTVSADESGLELASPEAARVEAAAAARGMWSELLAMRCDPRGCAFHVTRGNGEELFRLGFSELLDTCRPQETRPRSPATLRRNVSETHRRATAAKAEFRSSVDEMRDTLAESRALLARFATSERRPQPKQS